MLMDALNVQISGDSDGNARLMLGVLDCLPAVNQVCYTVYAYMFSAIVAAAAIKTSRVSATVAPCLNPNRNNDKI